MIVLGCVWLFLTGLAIVHWCVPSARLTEKAALAFPVSSGLHAAVFLMLMQWCQAPVWWSVLPFLPFLLSLRTLKIVRVAAAFSAAAGNRSVSSNRARLPGFAAVSGYLLRRTGLGFLEWAALLFVLFTTLQIFVHVLFVPAVEWDSVALWFMKGKALVVDGRITTDFTAWLEAEGLHPDYPWNVPAIYAWLSRLGGHFSESAGKATVCAFYVSLILILYCLARLRFQRPAAMLALSLYLAIPDAVVHVFYRDADTILETYLAALIFLALRRPLEFSARFAVLLCALVCLTCWTKREGLVYCAALLVPWLAWLTWNRAVKGRLFAVAAGSAVGIVVFLIMKSVFGVTTMFAPGLAGFHGITGEFYKLGSIVQLMATEALKVHRWNLTWLLVPFLFWARRDRYFLRILFSSHLLLYFLVYYLAPVDFRWHITTSWSRLLLHALPELYTWAVFVAAEYLAASSSGPERSVCYSPITFTSTRFFRRPSNSP